MIQLLVAASIVAAGMSTAMAADNVNTNARVQDHYKTVIQQTPYQVELCRDVNVSGDKTGDTVKGAILGGIIGNNVGNIDNGGAIGAILGGMLGHSNSNATGGTKRVCSTETRYKEKSTVVYSHSTISWRLDGKNYTLKFHK